MFVYRLRISFSNRDKKTVLPLASLAITKEINGWISVPFSILTLILLTWKIWCAPNNASKWQMVFNSEFKGLNV
jgi:hypothetical protein